MLDGITGIVEAEKVTELDRIKAAIVGEPGSGKSRLLTTARKPVLIYDFDDRRESIAGVKDVLIKTLVDADAQQPHAWADFESDIGTLEYLKQSGKLDIKSIGLDTVGPSLYTYAQNECMKTSSMYRQYTIGAMKVKIPQGFDVISAVQRMLMSALNRLHALNVDVYATFHIRREKAADSTQENPKWTGKYTVEPQNIKMLLPYFNERWMLKDDYQVQVHQDYEFNAITALHLPAGTLQPANIEQMIATHLAMGK